MEIDPLNYFGLINEDVLKYNWLSNDIAQLVSLKQYLDKSIRGPFIYRVITASTFTLDTSFITLNLPYTFREHTYIQGALYVYSKNHRTTKDNVWPEAEEIMRYNEYYRTLYENVSGYRI